MKQEVLLGATTVLLCAVLFYQTTQIADFGFAQVGADVWPKFIIGVMFCLASLQIAIALLRPGPSGARATQCAEVDQGLWFWILVPIVVFAAVSFFALAVPFIGFTLAGLAMVFGLLSAIGPKSPRALVMHGAIAGVAVGLVTFFFTGVMGVMLPGWAL